MQPVVTVGLGGSPGSLAAGRPGPTVDASLVHEHAREALLRAASPVVGRRGHRPGATPHPVLVAHDARHHGRRPVAVVPHD
ncbi:hypothetical protein [Streptomyces sp. IBSBF 3352]|uniref:hypothetical protein n=1 Tax=Streptomyces sp. IBSBF 3352 TaxID=2903523 RepID=UPI002FDBE2D7